MKSSISLTENIRPILATIKSVPIPARLSPGEPGHITPFVTLSRQPGAGAWSFAQTFVRDLNSKHPVEPPWTCWDRALVEKVAADHHLSTRLIDSLQESDHTWLDDLFTGFSGESHPDEVMVYHRVATTMIALAEAGHVVIVGRGGAFVTRKVPGGIHIRLVAPLERRIENIQASMEMTRQQAKNWIADAEHKRASFYKRFWRNESLGPDSFDLTVNTARISEDALIEVLFQLVRRREQLQAQRAQKQALLPHGAKPNT